MPEGSPGTGFDIRRLFSPGPQAREGREDPRTEPHVPAHAAPENPTPITLEDMSDPGGVGSVSKAEATLTHPSARDSVTDCTGRAGNVVGVKERAVGVKERKGIVQEYQITRQIHNGP